jgi:hypothetical protein
MVARVPLRAHEPWQASLDGFHSLVPPPDRFWADPFPITVGRPPLHLLRGAPLRDGKGHICCVEVKRDGSASQPVRVLERDYHLSYPFLIEHEGRLYMIPETAANRTVERGAASRSPTAGCASASSSMESSAPMPRSCSATSAGGCSRTPGATSQGADDELQLFSADALFGEWRAHRANPVKADVRGSRPAGKLYEEGGVLYRPSQICAPIYGSGVAVNRVTQLDDDGFREEEVRRIEPQAGDALLGIHTINRAGDLSVLDAFARRQRF